MKIVVCNRGISVLLQDQELVHSTIAPCGEGLANLSRIWLDAAMEPGAAPAGKWIAFYRLRKSLTKAAKPGGDDLDICGFFNPNARPIVR